MSESSHGGHKMGHAVKHLHKMHKEHGHHDHHRSHPAAAHAKVEGKAGSDKGMERRMERDERKDR